VPEGSLFCEACGTPVEAAQGAGSVAAGTGQAGQKGAPDAPSKKPQTGLIIAVIVAALVLIGGGVAGALIYSNAKKKQLAQQTKLVQKNTGNATAHTAQADDAIVYDPIIKAYQDFQASGFKSYAPALGDTFLARFKDADGTTAGGGIDDIAQATLVYLLKDINNDGTPELFVGVQESGITAVEYFDVWSAQKTQPALLLSTGNNQDMIRLLADGSLEEVGGRMGSYFDWVYALPAHGAALTVNYGVMIAQKDNTSSDNPYTFEQGTGAVVAGEGGNATFSTTKEITATEYARLTGRPDPAGIANVDLWDWALEDNRPNNKAVPLSWTPLASWK